MNRKIKLLIPYSYNPNWIGGTYYIENLLYSLSLQQGFSERFELYIFTDNDSFRRLQSRVPLPLKKVVRTFFYKVRNKIQKIFNLDLVRKRYDLIFPYNLSRMLEMSENRVCWIPDFQEKHFPEFFSDSELIDRERAKLVMLEKEKNVVFSSRSAENDFRYFYSENDLKTYVLNFAVHNDVKNFSPKDIVFAKYSIKEAFFLCSNQFWVHKNHQVVLEALREAVKQHPAIKVIFTGKEHDHRAPDYANKLKKLSEDFGLKDNVKFLGFIPRNDQLALMKYAIAVIQPSLFEGWSTVIEDAKSLSKNVICSDLAVHREQLGNAGNYFEPKDFKTLSEKIVKFYESKPKDIDYNYEEKKIKFGTDFLEIVEKIL